MMTDVKQPTYTTENPANTVSVITVVRQDVQNIRKTMDGVFAQTWPQKEYIVIDGGSTDGTAEYIRSQSERLAYWCSEPDGGIFEAMNKGIAHARGRWICFLNCGDTFVTEHSIEDALKAADLDSADVIYGHSIELTDKVQKRIPASSCTTEMDLHPVYRHGSSLVRTEVQKRFLFDLSKKDKLQYALDWDMIFRMYKAGCKFQNSDVYIEAYKSDGISAHPLRNRWYNYQITTSGKFNLYKFLYFLYNSLVYLWTSSKLYIWVKAFFMEYLLNGLIPHIPFWALRKCYFKLLRMKIGKGTFVMRNVYIQNPNLISIGEYSHINRGCILDARGGITIGNSVSVSHLANLITGSHDYRSPSFSGVFKPIKVCDYAWIGVGCTILQGVRIGKGAVVCTGAVVTHDVPDYEIVAGIPAHRIGKRPENLEYHCHWETPFT